MIYKVADGYVISSRDVWLPGVYDSEATARWAFQFSDETLQRLTERICHVDKENRTITRDDLVGARREGDT